MSLPFFRRLVLNGWMLSLFGVSRFDELADLMRREEQEGLDENKEIEARLGDASIHRDRYVGAMLTAAGWPD